MTNNPAVEDALGRLIEGNKRFRLSGAIHPDQTTERRQELSNGQKPFAVIVACSDSRVSPEIIFDQGLGDLFVIRLAGNIVDHVALGSVEYAVAHLGTPLVVVLGHSKCGAVTAAVQGGHIAGHIGFIVDAINPSVEQARGLGGDLTDNAIRINAKTGAGEIRESRPIISELLQQGKIGVVSAYYDIDTGEVHIL